MIVVCGEVLIDLVPVRAGGPYEARPGGGPANIAVGLGRLDVDVSLLARLATDPFGRRLRAHLSGSRVGLDLAVGSAQPTTLAVVNLDPNGAADYHFYIDGCADGGWRTEELPAVLPAGAALHVSGSLAIPVDPMGAVVEDLLVRERPHRVVTLDPNVRPTLVRDEAFTRARLDRWLRLADIVKVSEEDLAWVSPGRPVPAVAAEWRALGPTVVVVTRGAQGAHAVGPDGPVDLPAVPVTVADTVGAGDSFMSGLLAALYTAGRLTRPGLAGLSTVDLTAALEFALRVSAFTCTRPGADPPWRSELADG